MGWSAKVLTAKYNSFCSTNAKGFESLLLLGVAKNDVRTINKWNKF